MVSEFFDATFFKAQYNLFENLMSSMKSLAIFGIYVRNQKLILNM